MWQEQTFKVMLSDIFVQVKKKQKNLTCKYIVTIQT